MRTRSAAIGSAVFFLVAPGTVAGIVPWTITRWQVSPAGEIWPLRVIGAAMIAAGVFFLVDSFVRFARDGHGTPAPILPTGHLVVGGLHRHVRNPMHVGIASAIFGQAMYFGNTQLLLYGAIVWLAFHLFVLVYAEPTLRRTFGEDYDRFCRNVPRWLPRFTPWTGDAPR